MNFRRGFGRIGILITVVAGLFGSLMLVGRGFNREVIPDLMSFCVYPIMGYWVLYLVVAWLVAGFRAKD
jgi:hypothetical protein